MSPLQWRRRRARSRERRSRRRSRKVYSKQTDEEEEEEEEEREAHAMNDVDAGREEQHLLQQHQRLHHEKEALVTPTNTYETDVSSVQCDTRF
jgi:hypothetical protein